MINLNFKEKILQTALKLFANYGYEDVEMLEIAFDANICLEDFYSIFSNEEELYQNIIHYILQIIPLYNPSEKDIHYMLQKGNNVEDILKQFMHIQDMGIQDLNRMLFRFSIWDMHRNIEKKKPLTTLMVNNTRNNLSHTLLALSRSGTIAAYNYETLADIWYHVNFMLEYLAFNNKMYASNDEYHALNRYFISFATQGFTQINTEGIKLWKPLKKNQKKYPQDERTQVIETAIGLFNSQGYASVTMSKIAQAAGISIQHLYSFFSCKQDIIQKAFLLLREEALSKTFLKALEINHPQDAVIYLANACFNSDNFLLLALHKLIFKELYKVKDIFETFIAEIYREINNVEDILYRLIEENKIMPCPSQYIAMTLVFSVYSSYIDFIFFREKGCEIQMDQYIRNTGFILSLINKKEISA